MFSREHGDYPSRFYCKEASFYLSDLSFEVRMFVSIHNGRIFFNSFPHYASKYVNYIIRQHQDRKLCEPNLLIISKPL